MENEFPVRRWDLLMRSLARNATREIERRRVKDVPLRQLDCKGPIVSMKEIATFSYHLVKNWDSERGFRAYLYWTARLPFNCLEKSTYRELGKLAASL